MNADASPSRDSRAITQPAESGATRTSGSASVAIFGLILLVGVASGWFAWHFPSSVKVMLMLLAAWHGIRRLMALTAYTWADEEPPTAGARLLEWTVCILWFGTAILFSANRMDLVLFTVYGAGVPLIPTIWIQGVPLLWGLTMAAITALFFIHYLWRRMQGYGEGSVRLLLMATSIGMWWYAMRGVENILLGLLLFEAFQLLQGLIVAWRFRSATGPIGAGAAVLYRRCLLWVVAYLAVFSAYGILLAMGRVPAEGVVVTDTYVRVVAMLIAAVMIMHFLSDELMFRQLAKCATVAHDVATSRAWLPRLGSAVVWLGSFAAAGWLIAAERDSGDLSREVYENVVTAYPDSWRALTGYAVELEKAGQLASAVEQLTMATELNPDAVNLRIELGRMLRRLDQTERAVEEFQRAIALNPAAALAHTELGNALLAQGKFEQGLARFRDALSLRPNDPAAHIDVAKAHIQLRDLESALASFDEAIKLDPEFAMAYNGRGNVLWSQGDLDAAVKQYNEAIRLDPQSAKPYRNRAGVWLEKRNAPEALADLNSAIKLDGANAMDFIRRGDLYYAQEKFSEALQDYQTALQMAPQFPAALERLVTLWTSCPDEALRDLAAASQAARTNCQLTQWRSPAALQMLAVVLAAQGDYDEALRWQSEAVKLAAGQAKESYQKQLEIFRKLSEQSDAGKPDSGS
jgi:tetratricopeptide (TPR) repeat protein